MEDDLYVTFMNEQFKTQKKRIRKTARKVEGANVAGLIRRLRKAHKSGDHDNRNVMFGYYIGLLTSDIPGEHLLDAKPPKL